MPKIVTDQDRAAVAAIKTDFTAIANDAGKEHETVRYLAHLTAQEIMHSAKAGLLMGLPVPIAARILHNAAMQLEFSESMSKRIEQLPEADHPAAYLELKQEILGEDFSMFEAQVPKYGKQADDNPIPVLSPNSGRPS